MMRDQSPPREKYSTKVPAERNSPTIARMRKVCRASFRLRRFAGTADPMLGDASRMIAVTSAIVYECALALIEVDVPNV